MGGGGGVFPGGGVVGFAGWAAGVVGFAGWVAGVVGFAGWAAGVVGCPGCVVEVVGCPCVVVGVVGCPCVVVGCTGVVVFSGAVAVWPVLPVCAAPVTGVFGAGFTTGFTAGGGVGTFMSLLTGCALATCRGATLAPGPALATSASVLPRLAACC